MVKSWEWGCCTLIELTESWHFVQVMYFQVPDQTLPVQAMWILSFQCLEFSPLLPQKENAKSNEFLYERMLKKRVLSPVPSFTFLIFFTFVFCSDKTEKQTTLATVRQVIRDRSSALTALTPGTARKRPTAFAGTLQASTGTEAENNQLSITSYSRHHEASAVTRVVSPDTEDLSGVLNRSAQLRTSNRRRRASECGQTAEAAAAAALNASENYFGTDEMACWVPVTRYSSEHGDWIFPIFLSLRNLRLCPL